MPAHLGAVPGAQPESQDRATQPQLNFIRTLAMERAESEGSLAGFLKARYGVLNLEDLSKGQASGVIAILNQPNVRLDEYVTDG